MRGSSQSLELSALGRNLLISMYARKEVPDRGHVYNGVGLRTFWGQQAATPRTTIETADSIRESLTLPVDAQL